MSVMEWYMPLKERFEAYLQGSLQGKGLPQKTLFEAMQYSLLAGGKRIRPVVLLEFCRVCGGNVDDALPFAAAIEMVHSYSLIHDDLPCMDDDELRRGKPTNHKVFGEAMAVLAGDGLLTAAFDIMLAHENVIMLGGPRVIRSAHRLAIAAGASGMVGGQALDIAVGEAAEKSYDQLLDIHLRKTGALIQAAAEMGVILGGGDAAMQQAATRYAVWLGLAFQIRDDLLDGTGNSGELGKTPGSDKRGKKFTFLSLLGAERCEEEIGKFTAQAKDCLEIFDERQTLEELADWLALRNN